MLRPTLKKLLLMAAVVVAAISISAQPSQAWCGHWGWRHHGYYGGCYGYNYYPVAYSSCYSSCGWGYSWGCYRPSWYSCGSLYYGSCHSHCCNPCCQPVTDCCDDGVVVEPKAVEPTEPSPPEPAPSEPVPAQSAAPESPAAAEPAPVLPEPASVLPDAKPAPAVPDMPPILPPPPKDAMNRAMGGNGLLSVVVPEDARVYVNGMLTQTPGTYRQYVSRGLVPGYSYTYEVRVVLNRDGKVVSDSKTVQLRAGQTRDVSFDLQRSSPEMDPGMQLTASTLSR